MIIHDVEAELRKMHFQFKYFHQRHFGTQIKTLDGYSVSETGKNFRVLSKWRGYKLLSLLVEIRVESGHLQYYTLVR